MFYAIPLENKPSWRHPPWMTLLLILVNMWVFWGPQRQEAVADERAAEHYVRTALPGIELPAFVSHLTQTGSPNARIAERLYEHKRYDDLLEAMQNDSTFMRRLHQGQVITTSNPQYATWQAERAAYDRLRPAPFTARWAQDHSADAEWRPITWVTSAFLHGSTGHLLGNMLFLFLFGFSVELALGGGLYLLFYLLGAVGASALAAWAYAGMGGLGLGASGAVSALMGMYAVMYRMRRIRFFYQLFFYFNYVTAPALILLPAWIVNELIQHLTSGRGVAYMAHLGGLITGALLMALAQRAGWLRLPSHEAVVAAADDGFSARLAEAERLTAEMKFDRAVPAWRAAARLRPQDADVLRAWFHLAKAQPTSEDFHRSAKMILRLRSHDRATLALQHATYLVYLDRARPAMQLRPQDLQNLVPRLVRLGALPDAERLYAALSAMAPAQPGLGDTLGLLVNGLLQAGQRERARHWAGELQRLDPQAAAHRVLAAQGEG